MAIKNLIKRGFGYNQGSVKFIPTHGFSIGTFVAINKLVFDIRDAIFNRSDTRDATFNKNDKRDGEF